MSKDQEWQEAQINERHHWEGFIANVMKGPPDYGGERFWLDLWQRQAHYLMLVLFTNKEMPYQRVLEIGGGAVGLSRWLKGPLIIAVDPLADLFEQAFKNLPLQEYRLRKDVYYRPGPAEEVINVEDMGRFDLVFMFDCLDHCRDPGKVLQNIHAVLKPDGLFCESTTVFKKEMRISAQYHAYHPWAWVDGAFQSMVTAAGFDLVDSSRAWPCHPGFKHPKSNSDQVLHLWRGK